MQIDNSISDKKQKVTTDNAYHLEAIRQLLFAPKAEQNSQ
jgi:hypothetical protein